MNPSAVPGQTGFIRPVEQFSISGADDSLDLHLGFDTIIIPLRSVMVPTVPGIGAVETGPGTLVFLPARTCAQIQFRGGYAAIVVRSDPTLRAQLEAETRPSKTCAGLPTRVIRNPQQINAIVQVMRRVVAAGDACMESSMVSIARLLLWEVILNWTSGSRAAPKKQGQLDPGRIRAIDAFVEANLDEPLTLAQLAKVAGISRYHFLRSFKETTGLSPLQYVITKRVERAHHMLLTSSETIAEIAYDTGFSSQSHLNRVFKKHFGTTPGAIKRTVKGAPCEITGGYLPSSQPCLL